VIHGNIEESLNLSGVQIHGQHAMGPAVTIKLDTSLEEIGTARLCLPVLTAVSKIRNHRRDPVRRSRAGARRSAKSSSIKLSLAGSLVAEG